MEVKFIKKVTSEGKRRVINVPKKSSIKVGDDVLVQKINLDKVVIEE